MMGKILLLLFCAALSACGESKDQTVDKQDPVQCDPDNGGLILPDGFCALVVADHIGFLRHLTVNRNGDIYGSRRNRRLNLGGIVAIRDTSGNGKADIVQEWGDEGGLGIAIHKGYLYFGADTRILRYSLKNDSLLPDEPPEIVIDGLPEQERHAGKSFAFDDHDNVYVNLGASSNACQEKELIPGSPGLDPCPELQYQASIWRFNDQMINQQLVKNGKRYANGIRNAYALAWKKDSEKLYAVQHGRDSLYDLWPDLYTEQQGADLPAEELLMIEENDQFGWPYCYFDPIKNQNTEAPEYAGDGVKAGRCEAFKSSILAFPAHYSPNDMLFYSHSQFPAQYQNGAFIAFHGSYNRGSYQQVGYQVVYVPFKEGLPTGNWQVFADGFAGKKTINEPGDADYRPGGLAVGPDGSLYIADSVQGRIWRVLFKGSLN